MLEECFLLMLFLQVKVSLCRSGLMLLFPASFTKKKKSCCSAIQRDTSEHWGEPHAGLLPRWELRKSKLQTSLTNFYFKTSAVQQIIKFLITYEHCRVIHSEAPLILTRFQHICHCPSTHHFQGTQEHNIRLDLVMQKTIIPYSFQKQEQVNSGAWNLNTGASSSN